MKENGKKEAAGKLPPVHYIAEVKFYELIDTNLDSSLYTAQSKGNYKKKLKLKLLQGLILEETKNCSKKTEA